MSLKETALSLLELSIENFTKDLAALPPEAIDRGFGGVSRTAADMVQEINHSNDHFNRAIRGEPRQDSPKEVWRNAPDYQKDREAVMAAFRESSQRLMLTVQELAEADLDVAPNGTGPTRLQLCQFAAIHMWFHSGQLNYIQTLLGDGEFHW